jgi:hypothetical protein
MSETKPNSVKRPIAYFSKEQDTGDDQLVAESSFDLFNRNTRYVPVIFIKNDCNDEPNTIEIYGGHQLSQSRQNSGSHGENLHAHILEGLLKSSFVDRETGAILKLEEKKKTRLLVKRGVVNISLLLTDIALIYTRDKLVYAIDRDAKKYLVDKTLTELEEELDDTIFFRVNRQYIVNVNFIRSFKPYKKVKLLVDVSFNDLEELVIVSQQVAPAFKKWIDNA